MKSIRIFADSACDLDKELLDDLDVTVIPLTTHLGDDTYEDRVTITPPEFYKKLETFKGMPKTSQISPNTFMEKFKPELERGNHIICINFSSKLSGTYQSAFVAKENLETENIDVIDTKGASVGVGLIVREAAIMAKSGKTREEILKRIKYMTDRMEYIFAVGSLEMLKRGGRLSKGQALMGTLLNIKPILQFEDGNIVPYEKVRGHKAIFSSMINAMKERGYDLKKQVIGINYSKDIELGIKLKEEIEKEFGCKEFLIYEIGAAIGSHVGEGTVSVFFMRK